ncbi:MAG TPA: hypothetical protein VF498_14655 [Anaerolineales bacterium]
MAQKLSPQELNELLPWYLNGTLPDEERRQVEDWLDRDPSRAAGLAGWRLIQRGVAEQPAGRPSQAVYARVMQRIQASSHPMRVAGQGRRPQRSAGSFLASAVLAFFVLVLLWLAVRPGVMVQWSVAEGNPAAFRVYRALQGSNQFVLMSEIPAKAGVSNYSYVDPLLLPGMPYVYRVEGVLSPQGELAFSESIVSSPLAALPGQLAILFISLVIAGSLVSLASWLPVVRLGQKGKPV